MPRTKGLDSNIAAFLDMIAFSELGAKLLHSSDDGYNVIVGGSLMDDKGTADYFDDYAEHPNKKILLSKLGIHSTAAGRYQILKRFADAYQKSLRLPDFSPESQDAIALQMLREQKAIPHILNGEFDKAVAKCANIWASLPGAGYGQHENKLASLRDIYTERGGVIA